MQSYETVVRDLRAEKCRCGSPKRSGFPLCSACYWKLPEAYRSRLWLLRAPRRTQEARRLVYWRSLVLLGLVTPEKRRA